MSFYWVILRITKSHRVFIQLLSLVHHELDRAEVFTIICSVMRDCSPSLLFGSCIALWSTLDDVSGDTGICLFYYKFLPVHTWYDASKTVLPIFTPSSNLQLYRWLQTGLQKGINSIFHTEYSVQWCYLYLLKHVLELNQELLGIFSFVRDTVQGLGDLALQRHTEKKEFNNEHTCKWDFS